MNRQLTNAEKQAALWGKRFRNNGHLWGNSPSQTVKLLRGSLDELFADTDVVREIVTIGAGTFRDEVHLAAAGARIKAFEVSKEGIDLGKELADSKGIKRRIGFEHKNFADAKLRSTYDALLSHRTIHLLDDNEVISFEKKASQWVKPNGLIAVSARNFEDYDEQDMRWVSKENGVAEYTTLDRKGHIVHFWNEARFRDVFDENFAVKGFISGTEVESSTNSDKEANFTIMLAQRRIQFKAAAIGEVTVTSPKMDITGVAASAIANFVAPFKPATEVVVPS